MATRKFATVAASYTDAGGYYSTSSTPNAGIGLYANQNVSTSGPGNKEVFVSYELCTDETSCPTTARMMQIGDEISFEMKGYQVYGEVGVILNCSPNFTNPTFASKNSNQALQIRSVGHSDYWHIVDANGTIETAFQSSASSQTWDVSIELTSSTTATVTIGDGSLTKTYYPTLSNSQITHITFYLKDDWAASGILSGNHNFYFGDDGTAMVITNDGDLTLTDPTNNLIFGDFSDPLEPGSIYNTINLNLTVDDDITIEGEAEIGGDLTINPTKTLTLGLNSSNTYSQLKVGGSIYAGAPNYGTVTQEQHIASTGHYGISSPMTVGFGSNSSSGDENALYEYDAVNNGVYVGSYVSNGNASISTVGRGFFAPVGNTGDFLTAAGEFSVTGTPNTSHTHSLGYALNSATGGSGSGWNLIGNPYTCGLDWTSVTKNNVNNAYYVWDGSNATYHYYSLSGLPGTWPWTNSILLSSVIPPMQAFWVQVASSNPASIASTMANDGTVASTPTFYKTTPDNLILYAEDLSDQSLSDAMWITHASGYTNDFEGDRDAWKLSNYGGQANIYSYHNGEKMAINAIDLSSSPSIPVGVKAPANGKKYKLVLEQIVNNQDYQVILEDKLFNSFTDISNQGYSFTSGLWQNEDPRFILHINQSTVGVDESKAIGVKAYQQGNRLIVQGNARNHSAFKIMSLDGRVVQSGELQAGMASIDAPKAGVYIVQFEGLNSQAERVVIQ